jgi:nitrogen fixation/metabolism regulation signal transduction histidine kinase
MVIINIPYNPAEFNTKNEVWAFLKTLLQIFVFLFLGGGLIAYLLSSYITKSLKQIESKLKSVKIDQQNDPLEWGTKDEIGVLIEAYNSMIDKLRISTEKLSKSERQSAWREMAKQVAHEIKNPLTPMKLSVQHLERSLNPSDDDYEIKMKEFSEKMIQQIDLLSNIADAFSNYAELPKANFTTIDLISLIKSAIALFKGNDGFNIELNHTGYNQLLISGDEHQLLRVFNNLIRNSLQAFHENQKGNIKIMLQQTESIISLSIKDNGKGIPEEINDKIFDPSFTTKSQGKGLGLAIVEQIIKSHNGEISLASSDYSGACFVIKLPAKS